MKGSHAIRILKIEDDKHDNIIFQRAMREGNVTCQITEVKRAEEALNKLNLDLSSFDIIIVDYKLPGISGLDFYREYLKENISTPVIMLTGKGSEEVAIEALKLGINDYIIKDDYAGYLTLLPLKIVTVLENHQNEISLKKAAESIAACQNRYDTAVKATGLILYDWNPVNNSIIYGGALKKILGYAMEEMQGGLERWRELIHPEDLEHFNMAIKDSLSSHQAIHLEYRVRKKDGSYIVIEDSGYFFTDSNGDIKCMIGFLREITARKKIEDELVAARTNAERVSKLKSSFLSNMSHEIRTPLNAILGMIDLLEETKLNTEQRNFIGICNNAGKTLLTIINDILDYSKIDADQLDIVHDRFNIGDIIDDIEAILTHKAHEKGIQFDIKIFSALAFDRLGDVNRIKQILLNLLSNAIKFTDQGRVELRIEEDQQINGIKFTVADTGIGISSDNLTDIFSTFTQADKSITRRFGGTGLGLSISQKLVHMMGGDIKVESTLNEGSTFSFNVAASAISREKTVYTNIHSDLPILLIDANSTSRLLMKKKLQQLMPPIVETSSWEEGVKRCYQSHAKGEKFQLVLVEKSLIMNIRTDNCAAIKFQAEGFFSQLPVVIYSREVELIKSEKSMSIPCHHKCPMVTFASFYNLTHSFACYLNSFLGHVRPGNRTVLIVEDDLKTRDLLADLLQEGEEKVLLASNGKEAWEIITTKSVDIILSDLNMPEMGGLELLDKVNKLPNRIPFIILSAYIDKNVAIEALRRGATNILEKPVNEEKLIQLIKSPSLMTSFQQRHSGNESKGKQPSRRLLLVDDTVDNRALFKLFLRNTNIEIVEAINGEDALEKFKAAKFELVLMDISMPVMDGLTATKLIREWEKENKKEATTILALTAYALKDEIEKTKVAGCNGHITKPVSKKRLNEIITEYCRCSVP